VILDATIPGGAGWTANGPPATKWAYKNPAGVQGIVGMSVKASPRTPGEMQFKVQGRGADLAAAAFAGPLRAMLVFDTSSADPVQCGVAQFPGEPYGHPECVTNGAGSTVKCR
jgi:hypothetical protein